MRQCGQGRNRGWRGGTARVPRTFLSKTETLKTLATTLQAVLKASGRLSALGSLEENDPDAADEAEGDEGEEEREGDDVAQAADQEENDLAADLARGAAIK